MNKSLVTTLLLEQTYELLPDESKWRWTKLKSAKLPAGTIRVLEDHGKILGFYNNGNKNKMVVMAFDMTKAKWSALKTLKVEIDNPFYFFKWKGFPGKALIFNGPSSNPPILFDLDKVELGENNGKTNIKVISGIGKDFTFMKSHELTKPYRRLGILALLAGEAKVYFFDWARHLEGFQLLVEDKIAGKR